MSEQTTPTASTPCVKGAVFLLAIQGVKRLRAEGRLSREEVEFELRAPDIRYLDEKILADDWYPVATFDRIVSIVAEVNAELGEYVTPSPPGIPTPPAVDLIDSRCLYVAAPIDEVDAPAIRTGMPTCISLDAFPERRCGAKVRRIAPYVLDVEKQARTVEVEIEFANREDSVGLLPGYTADVEIILEQRDNVLRVPTETVLEDSRVLVYKDSDGTLESRRFDSGLSNWRYTEVLSGLEEGERIVVSVDREGVEAAVGRIRHGVHEVGPRVGSISSEAEGGVRERVQVGGKGCEGLLEPGSDLRVLALDAARGRVVHVSVRGEDLGEEVEVLGVDGLGVADQGVHDLAEVRELLGAQRHWGSPVSWGVWCQPG